MKIISNFKDYYDSVIAYGTDPLIYYQRKQYYLKPTSIPKFKPPIGDEISFNFMETWELREERKRAKLEDFSITIKPIYFCGAVYLRFEIKSFSWMGERELDEIFYSIEDFSKILAKNEKFSNYLNLKSYSYYLSRVLKRVEKIREFKVTDDFFINVKSPIFTLEKSSETDFKTMILANPMLRTLNFQKAKNPFQAFQEISMYIGNIFGMPGNPTVDVSDKTKIAKFGFDEWSFRKEKVEKKK
jgi:hypothetical protein